MLWTFDVPMLHAVLENEEEGVTDDYTVVIEPIDGDLEAVRHLDQSIDIGSGPLSPVDNFVAGRRVDATHLPTRMLVNSTVGPVPKGKMKLPSFIQAKHTNIVSALVKEIIERIEPDTHQFVPVTLEWKGGDPVEDNYFFFAPCIRLFALDHGKSGPQMKYFTPHPNVVNPREDVEAGYLSIRKMKKSFYPVFHRSRVGNAQVFGAGDIGTSMLMITDTVKNAFDVTRITGPVYQGPYALSD